MDDLMIIFSKYFLNEDVEVSSEQLYKLNYYEFGKDKQDEVSRRHFMSKVDFRKTIY